MLCLTLNSLGIQTCGENDATNWRIQDCSPSKVQTEVHPFGWYEKPGVCVLLNQICVLCTFTFWDVMGIDERTSWIVPQKFVWIIFYLSIFTFVSVVNQWTKSPSVCPRFSLRSPSKNGKRLLSLNKH